MKHLIQKKSSRVLLALALAAGLATGARAELLAKGDPNALQYAGQLTGIDVITLTVGGRQFKATPNVTIVELDGTVTHNLSHLKQGDNVRVSYKDDGTDAPDTSYIEVVPEALPPT